MAVLASLLTAMSLACLGAALALLGSAQTAVAAHDAQAASAAFAAQAALTLSSAELRARVDWAGVFVAGVADVCAVPGGFADATLFPAAPWDGSVLDLHALTAARQADSDALSPPGVSRPVWRLFEYGPISRLVPSDARRYQFFVVVWAAAGRDGLVLLHASALGAGGVKASVESSIRPDGRGVRQAIRAVR